MYSEPCAAETVGAPDPIKIPRLAVEVAKNAAAPPATGAVPLSAVIFPVAETVVAVTLPVILPTNPLSEMTGPLKVVFAISSSHAMSVY